MHVAADQGIPEAVNILTGGMRCAPAQEGGVGGNPPRHCTPAAAVAAEDARGQLETLLLLGAHQQQLQSSCSHQDLS